MNEEIKTDAILTKKDLSDMVAQPRTVDAKAHEAATSPMNDKPLPTDAQMHSGGYAKGHIKVGGMPIAIENPSGSRRRQEWPPLSDHYGYIKGTVGHDKDHVDCFVKPGTDEDHAGPVHVVNQLKDDGTFDEHKCMIGWGDKETARHGYLSNYTPHQEQNIHSVVEMPMHEFKAWAFDKGPHGPSGGPVGPKKAMADSEDDLTKADIKNLAKGNDGVQGIELGTDNLDPDADKVEKPDSDEKTVLATDSVSDSALEFVAMEDSQFEILCTDATALAPGELMRVRQAALMVDALNNNNRILTWKAVVDAIKELRERIKAGVVLSEYRHPDEAKTPNGYKFVDNPDEKTARVDDVSEPDRDGWVWITRTILDTPQGRRLAARFRAGNPPGVSTRYAAAGTKVKVGNIMADALSKIKIFTWDDVENPAFSEAGRAPGKYQLLTDEEKSEVKSIPPTSDREHDIQFGYPDSSFNTSNPDNIWRTPPPDGDPDDANSVQPIIAGDSTTHAGKAAKRQELTVKNKTILAALALFQDAVTAKQPADVVLKARRDAQDVILKAMRDGDDVKGAPQAYITAETNMEIAGYRADAPAPMAIIGNYTGASTDGYAPDNDDSHMGLPKELKPKQPEEQHGQVEGMTDEDRQMLADMRRERQLKLKRDSIEAEIGKHEAKLANLTDEAREFVLEHVRNAAHSADSVSEMLDSTIVRVSKIMSDATLNSRGLARGVTTVDPANPIKEKPRAEFGEQAQPWMVPVNKLLLASDSILREQPALGTNPDTAGAKQRRDHNMKKFIMPMLEQIMQARSGADKTFAGLMSDSADSHEKALQQVVSMANFTDATTLSQLYNQPSVIAMIFVVAFWDCRFIEFCQPFGRGVNDKGVEWGQGSQTFGNIVKLAVEYFSNPASQYLTRNSSSGAKYAENTAVDEASVLTSWLSYTTQWRKGAISPTYEGIRALGNGPLNYDTVSRHLSHLGWFIARNVDKDLGDEFLNISDEYQATAVTGEAYTTGNSYLPDLSVYNGSGSITVNLNPTKLASAAVATTDPSVVYGPTVLGAIRVKGRGNGTSSPYSGVAANLTVDPIVPPRLLTANSSNGAPTTSYLNPFSITVPGSMVQGYLSDGGDIVSIPGTTATYAVDWENGVVVFNTAAGLSGSGGVITTSVTLANYSVATNWTPFVLTSSIASASGLWGTSSSYPTYEAYLSTLITKIRQTAAYMGSGAGTPAAGRFVKPDLGVMTLNVAALLESATLFYKLNSPNDTELYPNEEFFAETSGVNLARVNTPWRGGDQRMVLNRRGTTKYGIDQPLEMIGPITPTNSTGSVYPRQTWLAQQNEIIATPQVTDQSGNILNPVARTIKFI